MLMVLPTPNARLESAHSQILSGKWHALEYSLHDPENIAAIVCSSAHCCGKVSLGNDRAYPR